MPNIHAVLSEPGDNQNLLKALAVAMKLAENGSKHLTIYVPRIAQLESSDLSKVLGEKNVKDLKKKKFVNSSPVSLTLVSDQTIRPHQEKGVVIGLWCSPSMLQKLDECQYSSDIVALSWTVAEMEPWVKARRAKIY
ncbi:hypothetical protein M445_00460 [Vibrio owensii 47666-1]|uniref:hypothetical protein n=1 Tax=Vibrio owensii TaxID=696485 RepID=UPI0005848DCB|nr:hypothetical protein [Vibrio owensii]KIF50338.1 hypothetical protein M445_00460 [Vibrio owensii 47666-1]